MFTEMSRIKMGESQQVQSLDAAMTNVIFLPSQLLAPEKTAWKCLKEKRSPS